MSCKNHCHDNVFVESFSSFLECEWLNQYKIRNITALKGILKAYIKWFNND
ncbi:integrase core domain-containing protein [Lactiplantibacillus plantarum]|uniref:integrase core domain-containing protein n=1 Tax=Lactiplantibacillus plantarum TaxID=1590 RepID=UPI0013CEFBF9